MLQGCKIFPSYPLNRFCANVMEYEIAAVNFPRENRIFHIQYKSGFLKLSFNFFFPWWLEHVTGVLGPLSINCH